MGPDGEQPLSAVSADDLHSAVGARGLHARDAAQISSTASGRSASGYMACCRLWALVGLVPTLSEFREHCLGIWEEACAGSSLATAQSIVFLKFLRFRKIP